MNKCICDNKYIYIQVCISIGMNKYICDNKDIYIYIYIYRYE